MELLEECLSVVGEFGNTFADVVQGFVPFFFLEFFELWIPAECEFLDGTYVNVSVAEPFRNFGHVLVQKAPVLRDGISAKEVFCLFCERLDETERFEFCILEGILRTAAAIDETALVMVPCVPFVHAFENIFRLVNGYDRSFGENIQIGVGNNGRYFENDIFFWIETRHF